MNKINMKELVLSELSDLAKKENFLGNIFKARAYNKVVNQIKLLDKVTSMEDLKSVSGIGSKINLKIEEILKTGKLRTASAARKLENFQLYNELLEIYGIGPAKAKELIEKFGIKSISELRAKLKENPNLLNNQQILGLKYLKDFQQKIPRSEMEIFENILKSIFTKLDPDILFAVTGSYRRNEKVSGDIDILISSKKKGILGSAINVLKDNNYIQGNLALGNKKYMGIIKLPGGLARRIDILVVNRDEYSFALLYFTGDASLNIKLRSEASKQNLKLNEKSLTSLSTGKKIKLKSEKEIFEYLGYGYVPPNQRSDAKLKKII